MFGFIVWRRFKIDTIFFNHYKYIYCFDANAGFEYKKDSVMVVTEEEYDKCRSSHPMFFSNNGDTTFTFDRPGLFYFISGVSGHCQRGLKMIVKVLEIESPPPAAPVAFSSPKHNAASALRFAAPEFILVSSFVGAFFM